MYFSTLALSAAIALPLVSAYPAKVDGLHCRSGPGTSYAIKKTYSKGTQLTISCQTPGTNVDGDTLWDKTSDGCYVADYYVSTGTSGYVTSKCGTSAAKTYPAKVDGLHCRSGPGTSYAIKKTYSKGTKLTISCQTPGTNVDGDSLWDKTSDGCYVADYYVLTGTSGYVASKCAGSSGGSSGGGNGEVNEAALELIASLEGWSATYYYINGHKTIGYGHDCVEKSCAGINPPLTKAQGLALLRKDIVGFEECVCKLPNAKYLNANEYGALVSFAYNSGCGGVANYWHGAMTAKNFKGICAALPTTNTLHGELNNRRRQEGAFCAKATTQMSGC